MLCWEGDQGHSHRPFEFLGVSGKVVNINRVKVVSTAASGSFWGPATHSGQPLILGSHLAIVVHRAAVFLLGLSRPIIAVAHSLLEVSPLLITKHPAPGVNLG